RPSGGTPRIRGPAPPPRPGAPLTSPRKRTPEERGSLPPHAGRSRRTWRQDRPNGRGRPRQGVQEDSRSASPFDSLAEAPTTTPLAARERRSQTDRGRERRFSCNFFLLFRRSPNLTAPVRPRQAVPSLGRRPQRSAVAGRRTIAAERRTMAVR